MRKLAVIGICLLLFALNGCGLFRDAHIPDGYVSAEEHFDPQGFQDHTDFCVYRYDSAEEVKKDTAYRKMTQADVDDIAGYFSNFREWMEAQQRLDEYTFDETCISEGDYCFVKTLEGQPIAGGAYGKYDNYTVYCFDSESLTLYYIHSNI